MGTTLSRKSRMLALTRNSNEVVRRWRHRRLQGVEVLHFSGVARDSRFFEEDYTLILDLEGGHEVCHRGVREQGEPGSLLLCQPGEVYSLRWRQPSASIQALFIDPGELLRAAKRLGHPHAPPAFAAIHAQSREVVDTLTRLHLLLGEPEAPALETEACYARLFEHLLRDCMTDSPPDNSSRSKSQPVLKAHELLERRLEENVQLGELARYVGLSPFHLLRLFRDEVGMPPHAYQLQLRLHRARRLLRHGVTPSEVSMRLGFADQSHLSRHFKKQFLISPAQYVRACGGRGPGLTAEG
jgi:AraC-like DNA-binding protein